MAMYSIQEIRAIRLIAFALLSSYLIGATNTIAFSSIDSFFQKGTLIASSSEYERKQELENLKNTSKRFTPPSQRSPYPSESLIKIINEPEYDL